MADRYDSNGENLIPNAVEDSIATDANTVLVVCTRELDDPRRAWVGLEPVESPGNAPNVISTKPTKRTSRARKHNDAVQRSSPLGTGACLGMDATRHPLCKGKAS
jgi:hypothetical protein